MENPREQQPVVSGSQLTPNYAVPATYAAPQPATSERPSRWLVFRRGVRLLIRRLIYGLVLLFRPLRPIAGFVVVVLALLGVIGWMAFQLWGPAPAETVGDTRAPLIPPSTAVENYIKGQQNYNAELMWSSLSTESQANQLNGGASKETLQERINQKKTGGLRFSKYEYIGGVQLEQGGNMYVYSVDVQTPSASGKLPMTFLVDSDGKIVTILDSTSILSDLALPRSTE